MASPQQLEHVTHQMSDVILAFASVLMACGLICVFTSSSLLLGFDSHILNKVYPTMFYFFVLKKMHPSYLGC